MIAREFDEADRRDPRHRRTWVALADGNSHQIQWIKYKAKRRRVKVAIICDFVHVLQYRWNATGCLYPDGSPTAEQRLHKQATRVLEGHATNVGGQIRRQATNARMDSARRPPADEAATYLTHLGAYLDCPTALGRGWPILTGIVEGACRHLIKDRTDITGARWGLAGAEAILKLRAPKTNGDLEDYRHYHLTQEHRHVHQARYHNHVIPRAKRHSLLVTS